MTERELFIQKFVQQGKAKGATPQQVSAKLSQALTEFDGNKPSKNGLVEAGKALFQPLGDYLGFVGDAASLAFKTNTPRYRELNNKINQGTATVEEAQEFERMVTPTFGKAEDYSRDNIAKTTIKRTAGGASYFVPGTVGAGTIGKVGGLALSGAVSGGLSGIAQGDDLSMRNFATGALAGGALSGGMGIAGKYLPKAGKVIQQKGKDYAIKSTRISDSGQNAFRKATGQNIDDYIAKNNLYGQDMDRVADFVGKKQSVFDDMTIRSGKKVPAQEIIKRFDDAITRLESGSNALNPANRQTANFLRSERDIYLQQIGGNVNAEQGLDFLTEVRRGIDSETPARAFNPGENSNMRELGGIYRDTVNTAAGTKGLGLELRDAYKFRDVLERAPKGKNTQPIGLASGLGAILGSELVGKAPMVGGALGYVGTKVLNHPRVVGAESKALQRFGGALSKAGMPTGAKSSVIRNTVNNALSRSSVGGDKPVTNTTTPTSKPEVNVFRKPKTSVKSTLKQPKLNLAGY